MTLKIHLIGQFKLEADGATIDLPSRPAQSLLAYLALNQGVIYRREKLASLFWLDAAESNARSYLRQALWRIRKAFEEASIAWEDYLEISDISICFKPEGDYWLDAEEFLKTSEDSTIDELLAQIKLYHGELLPGFYDDWILPERDRFQAAYQHRMTLLVDKLIQEKRWDDAIQHGEAWLRLGNSPEPAFRALMQAYAGIGDQAMVSNIYQRCMDQLDRELGLDPSAETRSLYDKLCWGETQSDMAAVRPPEQRAIEPSEFLLEGAKDHTEHVIFVSREKELFCLQAHLEDALHNQGKVIFVTGETGSGKTALLNEFIRRVQKDHPGLLIVMGNCNAHTGLGDPYLPFREVLEMLTGDVQSRWAAGTISSQHARLLWESIPITAQAVDSAGPGLIHTFLQSNPLLERVRNCTTGEPDWFVRLVSLITSIQTETIAAKPIQSDLFDQYSRVFKSVAQQMPVMIVMDDLQWADPGSINLLFHLGRQLAGSQILIIGTYRSEEVAIGRDGERHPLAPVVSEFTRIYGDIAINLDQAENRVLLEALIDSEPNHLETAFRDMLFRQTRGNPLFTLELLRGLQERGDLVQDANQNWVEGSTLDWGKLPARVEAVIMERINRLPPTLQRILRIASVEGEIFTAEVVAEVAGISGAELHTQLSEELDRKHRLVRAQSIQRVNGKLISGYRFRHIQIQKFLYGSLNQVERVHLHEQVGYVLEALYGIDLTPTDMALLSTTEIPVMQLARHFQEAQISDKAVHYLHLAGERAQQLSAYKEATAYINQALDILLSQPKSPERDKGELTLQYGLGKAMRGIISVALTETKEIYLRARELCHRVGDPRLECQIVGELAVVHYVRREYHIAKTYATESLLLSEQTNDPVMIAIAHWMLGFISFALGEFRSGRNHLQKMLEIYDPDKYSREFIYLHGVDCGISAMAYDACCLWCLGYPEQAFKTSAKAFELAKSLDHPFTYADVLSFAGCIFHEMVDDTKKLFDLSTELVALSDVTGLSWHSAGTRYRGGALALLGDIEGGTKIARAGIKGENEIISECFVVGVLGNLALANLNADQLEASNQLLEEAFEIIEKDAERYCESKIYRIQAEVFLKMGDEEASEASYRKALEVAQKQEAKSWELQAAIGLGRLWQAQGKIQEANDLLSEIYEWFQEGFEMPDLLAAKSLLDELNSG